MNARNRDWEDLALWQDHKTNQQKLCAGDIGSYHEGSRYLLLPRAEIIRDVGDVFKRLHTPPSKEYLKVPFTEKDSPAIPIQSKKHDAETLLVDPHTAQFLIVTKKSNNEGALYVLEPIDALSPKFERIKGIKIRAND